MHDLPFQTITQFAGLGLTLIAGWFLGLASHSGGRKWRERLQEEEIDNAGYRDRAESDLRDAGRRIRDLEAENAKLRAAAPVAPVAVEAVPAPASAPVVEPEGHSTAAVVGAAVAGAAVGAAVTHVVEAQAEAAPAEPAEEAPVGEAPVAEAHPEPVPAEPVAEVPAHPEHAH